MKASQIGGGIALVFGLGIAAAQIVREVPWQAGIALGLLIAICGAVALAGDPDDDPPSDGGTITPLRRP